MSNGAGTAPDPRQMGAGVALDMLIATVVMGWRWLDDPVEARDRAYVWPCWVDSSNNIMHSYIREPREWAPSTHIQQAWMVHERIADLGLHHQYATALVRLIVPEGYYISDYQFALITASAEDRCRAALWVVRERQ